MSEAWDLSCTDWWDRLRAGRPLVPDLPRLNAAEGDRAVAVFNRLRLADVPGTPTLEEAGGDWFRAAVRALFGSVDPVTKARMIRELFMLVPKKNSKTTNGAMLMLTALLLNQRPRAPFLMTAPVQDVADLAFSAVAGAIALDPVLDKKFHVREHLKTIVHRETKATLEIMTFDPAVVTGRKVVGALIDELHVAAKMAKADKALRQLRGGMLPYPEAFLAFITTQSDDAPVGIFRDELLKARAIRDGQREGAMLPVLYEFPADVQRSDNKAWRDPAMWSMVTPNAGKSITVERLVEEARVASETSEAEFRAWASQHLNVEIGLALMSNGWAGASFWEACEEEQLLVNLLDRSEIVTIGIDGGGLDDLLGLAVMGRERDTGRWLLWTHAWAHPSVLERNKQVASRLMDFAAAGELTLVQRVGDDVEELADIVARVKESGLLDRDDEKQRAAIGVDAVGIGAVLDALEERGIEPEQITAISQGWRLAGAIKTTERRLAAGEMVVSKGLLMPWCAGNARVEPRSNAVLITKQASGSAKIDPLMAAFNSVELMSRAPALVAAPEITWA